MLKSIELVGFKSFAKKGELSFESSITAIVGPNGSGKSNTAEAFRFVLGEQGGKSMRIKKGTDLIWGGSHTLPRGSRAGVKLVLDNTKHLLDIDFDEVVVERSVLRDGTNEYLINGSKVRLKDIQDLLAGANVGSSGHHIISQGQADRVLGASPKERREMLEDALGLKAYQLKKIEAARKLDATMLNQEKAESRRRELVPHLTFLKRQVARVEEAQKVQGELKVQALRYFASEQEWIATEKSVLKECFLEPRANLVDIEGVVSDLRNLIQVERDVPQADKSHAGEQVVTEQKEQLISLRSVLAELRTELGRVAGQLEMLQVVEQKTASLPNTISRKEVKVMLEQVLKEFDADTTSSKKEVKELLKKFVEEITVVKEQTQKPQDTSLEQERTKLVSVQRELLEQVAGQEQAITKQESQVAAAQAVLAQEQQKSTEHERDLYKATAEQSEVKAILAVLERREVECEQRAVALQENIGEVQILLGEILTIQSSIPGEDAPSRRDVERLKIRLEQRGNLGTEVLVEYKEAQEHHDFLNQEIMDLQNGVSTLEALIQELDTRMQTQFNKGLALINREFNSFFTTLFDGGGASLALQKISKNIADEEYDGGEVQQGVEVSVNLPRKKVTTLETLSGGERALASIALIFAMSQVNPPPFIILDETDAALDEANSQRYAHIVKKLSERSQIILITHNRATMASANTLYGVTMGSDGVSELLSVRLTDAEQFAK